MSNKLVSIIVPVYNVDRYLDECIKSILNKTYKNYELILIDDGSTDNSGSICDSYARCDERIKVLHQKTKVFLLQGIMVLTQHMESILPLLTVTMT